MGQKLHQGKLSVLLEDLNIWLLELDNDNDSTLYLMRWDCVTRNANADTSTYTDYQFPVIPVPPPAMEAEIQGSY